VKDFKSYRGAYIIKLCARGAQTYALPLFCDRDLQINPMALKLKVVFKLHASLFRRRDLDLEPMTLKPNHNLDILKMPLHTENKIAR